MMASRKSSSIRIVRRPCYKRAMKYASTICSMATTGGARMALQVVGFLRVRFLVQGFLLTLKSFAELFYRIA